MVRFKMLPKMDVPAVAIRPMTENDLDPVMAIELDSFSRPWTRDHFTAELDSSRSFPFVACTNDGAIAGYICPTLVLDEGEILDVAVRRDCRGAGIGVKLVARAIAYLAERGATVVLLEVRVSNESAISLYRRFGFKESGRRKGYYENGEDAILMYYTIDDSEGRADAV